MEKTLETGMAVKVQVAANSPFLSCVWWPKGEVTGKVQKLFKNGQVAVAVDQLYVAGGDNKRTLHFNRSELV